jgi:NYN domain
MEQTTYVFIDGNYIRQAVDQAMKEVFGVPGDLAPELIPPHNVFRAYFYDCIDELKKDSETDAEFQGRRDAQNEMISRMRARPGMHLRPGTLSRGRNRTQKEVDVLLAVDMLTHGFNRNMTHAILVTGDLDFRPVVEALVRSGVFVNVWYEKRSAAKDLPAAADFGQELNWQSLYNWNTKAFHSAYQPPAVTRADSRIMAMHVALGECEGRRVELMKLSDRGPFVLQADRPDGVWSLQHVDRQVLERFFSVKYGSVTWNP